ncbi:MAG TPA: amino acid adenylation domain-containing protein [Blastocatellia bacterium]|nr:amino acid adenylation domain-containing protein [Blastocatellia bacterium]
MDALALIKAGTIPKTSSGKIQRRACKQMFLTKAFPIVAEWQVGAASEIEAEAPDSQGLLRTVGEIQSWLASQIATKIRVDAAEIAVDKPTTQYGIDSLVDIELAHAVEIKTGVTLPALSFLQGLTVAELAHQIQGRLAESQSLPKSSLTSAEARLKYPLSYGQQAVWFLHQLAPESAAYNIVGAVRIRADLDDAALRRCFQQLIDRHPSLRTTFNLSDGKPVQRIREYLEFNLQKEDASRLDEETLRDRLVEEAHRPFDLENGPVLRVNLFSQSDKNHVLLLAIHHVVADLWSLALLLSELGVLYEAETTGAKAALAAPKLRYTDYVCWQAERLAGPRRDQLWAYWQKQLAGASTVLNIPTDRPRPSVQTYQGASELLRLGPELTQGLKTAARDGGATLNVVLIAALQSLLYRYTGQEDILIGCPSAGREQAQLKNVVGYFVNPLVIRADLSANPTFDDFLTRTRRTVLGAFEHQDFPFQLLVEQLEPERDASRSPVFQVMFALQKTPMLDEQAFGSFALGEEGSRLEVGGLVFESIKLKRRVVPFDLTLMVAELENGLAVSLQYNTDLFDSSTAQRMLAHLEIMLDGVTTNSRRRISSLPLLTEREAHQLLFDWNNTRVSYPDDTCIHALFETRAEENPHETAVQFEGERLSYGELNRRANQLAHYLRSLGVKPDALVGIYMERSLNLVVALLGVLKAGGAYVPIDPAYPKDRIAFMLEDSRMLALLSQQDKAADLPRLAFQTLCLDSDWPRISEEPANNPVNAVAGDNLAYVIYTSGSTGQPKGVMSTHGGLLNRLLWMQEAYNLTASDRVLQKTPYSFDVSVWEFLWPLATGARLVLARPGGHQDAAYLVSLMGEQEITTLHFVPSMLRVILQEDGLESLTSLRQVICSGEALPFDLQEKFFARSNADLHNLYGPTEASIDVTYYDCREGSNRGIVPIGKPIANTQIHILDEHLQPVPLKVAGELHIGGIGLARGYINRPDLTAERFVPSPFGSEPGARLYKTGDLARWLEDGNVEYLGRIDFQVKIRGFRIELGEIEASLNQHPAIEQATVMAKEYSAEDKRLIAYVVPDSQNAHPVRQMVRLEKEGLVNGHLRHELPNGMVVFHKNKSETDFVYSEVFEHQTYLRNGITLEEGACIFDVGANIGQFTLFMGLKLKSPTIYAFEPLPPTFEVLRLNSLLYGINARLFECGLSNESRTATFTYYPYDTVISGQYGDAAEERESIKAFLINRAQEQGGGPLSDEDMETLLTEQLKTEQYDCKLRTLSEVIREHGVERIDLLKVDVEKSEMDVLLGIEERDWSKIRQIIIEVHDIDDRLKAITEMLSAHGYELTVDQDQMLKGTKLYSVYAVRPVDTPSTSGRNGDKVSSDDPAWYGANQLINDLRVYLKGRLPDYMVPSAFVVLDEIPVTPNGKVNRQALPVPDRGSLAAAAAYEAPRNPVEEAVAMTWAQVLEVSRVGITNNFFELGGTSLIATQVMSRLGKIFDLDLPLRAIFQWPTVKALSERIEELLGAQSRSAHLPIRRAPRDETLPLSFAQHRLWFIDQFEGGSYAYNMPGALKLSGRLDVAALEESLNQIIRRHEVLRTSFGVTDGRPSQIIAEDFTLQLPVADLSHLPRVERDLYILDVSNLEAKTPFDLAEGPLIRARLVRVDEDSHILFVTMHHIISDGWSLNIFLKELLALYEASSHRRPSPLRDLPIQYADFTLWQRQWLQGDTLAGLLSYWKKQLGGELSALQLPTDRPRLTAANLEAAKQTITIPKTLSEDLKSLSVREGATPFMALLAAFNVLLYRYSGQEDILVGTPIANRNRAEIEGLIGLFVNTLILRTDLQGKPSFRALLGRVREVAVDAYAYQDLPFEKIVEELQPDRDLTRNPLFQVMIDLQDAPLPALEIPGLSVSTMEVGAMTTKYIDLVLHVVDSAEGLVTSLEYSTDLFEAATINRMLGHFQTVLRAVVGDPDGRVSELPLLTEQERSQILAEWNDSRADYPLETCVYQIIEAAAEEAPDAIAVVFERERLTYRELNRRSNQLAHYLRRKGVGLETLVGIFMEHSVELIVGMIGVMKAGGAYVALDPEYPPQRLASMLENARPHALLAQERLLERLPDTESQIICVDRLRREIAQEADSNPNVGVSADNAAIVLYTSGSTGKPKGVVMTHRGTCNHIFWVQHYFPMTESDSMPFKYSVCFDASVFEVLYPLFAKARLVIVPQNMHKDVAALVNFISRHEITAIDIPTPLLPVLMEDSNFLKCESLRQITCASDSMSVEVKEHYFATLGKPLIHFYGPCEASIGSTFNVCKPGGETNIVSVGKPVSNTQIYVLDPMMQPVPVGITGEIYVGGVGVTRGYLNKPDVTAERFIPDPFTKEPGARVYKTGDRGRYRPDGNLEFAGRIDHQVKIRGYRVELGDVEAAIMECPQVEEAVVIAKNLDDGQAGAARNRKALAAYVVFKGSEQGQVAELRKFLAKRLPGYMVPSVFVPLAEMRLNSSGKIDVLALPDPAREAFELETDFVSPRNAVEEVLSRIWSDVLEVQPIGVHNNFFELGGHSLAAAQVIYRVRDLFRVELPLRSLFEGATLAELAQNLIKNETSPGRTEKIAQAYKMVKTMSPEEIQRSILKRRKGEMVEA